jgi:hypothetical protein
MDVDDAVLNHFRHLAEAMEPEAADWQWIGPHPGSQRMFEITERRAKEFAARHGGTARRMDR